MNDQGFCQKDNRMVPLERGCLHPKDYCRYRQACLIYHLAREREREEGRSGEAGADRQK